MSILHQAVSAPRCLTVLTVSEQKAFGKEWDADSRLSGLPTVQSVVIQVVKTVYELDEVGVSRHAEGILFADHWQHYTGPEQLVLGEPFPAHALISVDSIETADEVVEYLNKLFERNRGRYPKKIGWHAMAAHSQSKLPFDRNHPFFRYKETGVMDSRCCRFLVVNKMAVEGMNNRYLLVWGAAELCTSKRAIVQRIGRPLRSAAIRQDGQIIIPPASHDRVYIITHEMFESTPDARGLMHSTAATIRDAIGFIVDMQHATADIMTLDEYVEAELGEQELREDSGAANLTRWVKFQILTQLGQSLRQGRRPQIARIVRQYGGNSALRRHCVRAFAQSALDHHPVSIDQVRNGVLIQTPVDAIHDIKTKLLRVEPPTGVDVLEAERRAAKTLDMASARDWVGQYTWSAHLLVLLEQPGGDKLLETVNGFYQEVDGMHGRTTFELRQTPAARIISLANEISGKLDLDDAGARRTLALVLEGALHYLPFPGAVREDFDDGGKYCLPEITFALRNETFVMQLQAWVCFNLLTEHHLDNLWAVLRFEQFWNNDE